MGASADKLEAILVALLMYGPSCLGLVVVVGSCVSAKRNLTLLLSFVVGVVLHLLSSFIIRVFVGMSEAWSGEGEGHAYPLKYCLFGLVALVLPLAFRTCYHGLQKAKAGH